MQQAPASRENAPEIAFRRSFRPRTFNRRTQARFLTVRIGYWLARVPGPPTPRQVTLAESVAQLEWGAEVARHENTLSSLRDLREHLRLRDRLVGDLERSVREAAEAAAEPLDPMTALATHLEKVRRQRDPQHDENEAA